MKTSYKTQPLKQVCELCETALSRLKLLNASFISFFTETMVLVLSINGRINFQQLARFGQSCCKRFEKNFRKPFDWLKFNLGFVERVEDHLYAIALDPSYISKSGKKTPGLGYFWSGCAQAVKRGLEILGIALVDANAREATSLRAVQTIKKPTIGRPPKCVEHVEKDSLMKEYLLTLYNYKNELQALSKIVVADAYFSKATFVQGLEIMDFDLVSRFRDDVRLRYLYTGLQKQGRGRKKEFDGVVDINNLRSDVFQKEETTWDKDTITIYSAVVNAVSLQRNVKVVIVEWNEDADKKTQSRKVFFSTDTSLTAKQIIAIYRSRFQIEFLFRDAKQFMGLTHCQARSKEALDFAFNLSLSAVNIANAYCKLQGLDYSICDVKMLMHNAMMIERIISMFGKMPNLRKIRGDDYTIFKDLLLLGVKDAA